MKPAFFRHERLQELETKYATLRPMLVFQGLWTQADREGRFVWQPRQLKLDILPFVDFDMAEGLELLRANGFIERYEVSGRSYGYIPTWHEHQKPHHQEAPSRIPTISEATPKAIRESPTAREGSAANSLSSNGIGESPKGVRESPNGFDREGGMGRENRNGKGNGANAPLVAGGLEPTPEDLPPLTLARGLIETLNIPFSGSLVGQVAECIKAKARESGVSFAEAHDYIRGKALKAKPAKWIFWFRDAQYDAPVKSSQGNGPAYTLPPGYIPESEKRRLKGQEVPAQ